MTNSILWLLILAILIFIEIITLGLTTIWFAGGALIAFIISLFYDNLLIELILFLVISLLLLYFTRPLVLKYFNPKKIKINHEGIVGKTAMVANTIDNVRGAGLVVVDGTEWPAKALNNIIIEKGHKVKIHGISGNRLIVNIEKEENK